MRENKYRGKTKEGKWVYGSLILSQNSPNMYIGYAELLEDNCPIIHYDEVIPETVGQPTEWFDIKKRSIANRGFKGHGFKASYVYRNRA